MDQLKNNPKTYERLRSAGYTDDVIPLWVARPKQGDAGGAKDAGGAAQPDGEGGPLLRSAPVPTDPTHPTPSKVRYPGQRTPSGDTTPQHTPSGDTTPQHTPTGNLNTPHQGTPHPNREP